MKLFRPAFTLILMLSALLGLAYPLAMTGIAQALMPARANGSLLTDNGTVTGSEMIGQNLKSDRYFHPRPSRTTATDPNDASKSIDAPYNASNSGGSNLAPSSAELVAAVKERAAASPVKPAPRDSVTASASGLDPHISPQGAAAQLARIAKARNVPEEAVRKLMESFIEPRLFGFVGEPRINVLKLNRALDKHFK